MEKLLTFITLSVKIDLQVKERYNMNISEIPFNDEFVSAHLTELLDLKIDRHIIEHGQILKVIEILWLENNSAAQLQAKRNSVVKLLTDDRDDEAAWATMSGVTHVIDSFLMNLLC